MKYYIEIDYSTLDTLLSCERKAVKQYHEGYSRPDFESPAIDFGRAVHKFLELYDANGNTQRAVSEAMAIAQSSKLKEVEAGQRYALDHLELLLNRYQQMYGSSDKRYTPVATELNLKHVIHDNDDLQITYVGNIDAVVKDTMFDEHAIMEHKTAFSVGEYFEWRTWPNTQVLGYWWLANKAGYDVTKVIFNVLQSTGYYTAKRTGKVAGNLTDDKKFRECFIRYEVPIDPVFVPEFEALVLQVVQDLVGLMEGKRTPRYNPPNSCTLFNSKCLFQDVCRAYPQDRADILQFNYEQRPWRHFKIKKGAK